MFKNAKIGIAVASILAGMMGAAQAGTQSGVKAGALTCDVSSGWGVIFGSTRDVRCSFQPIKGGIEHYTGKISKYGVDIGYTHAGVIIWAVLAPTSDLSPGALAGHYAGATAGATVGLGAGVHALVGGSTKSIAFQPVSIEGNAGLNIAAGVADLTLSSAN
jgi:Protein of unknown function (DUF992)